MNTIQWRRWTRRNGRRAAGASLRVEHLEARDVPSSTMYGGTLNGSSQTYNHPTAAKTGLSGQVVPFQAMAFRVSTDDVYTLTNESNTFTAPSAGDGFFALYQTSFNPSNPLNNIVAANDNAGGVLGSRPQITQEFVPGTTYFLITSPATGGSAGDFTDQISSSGAGTYTFNTHSLPAVDSPTATAISGAGATLGGTVEGDGGATVTERGIVYSITSANGTPTIGGSGVTKVTAGSGTGVFTASVTGLALGTNYTYRAYATNAVGTFYSSPVQTFVANTPPAIGGIIATPQTINDNATVQPFILATVTDPDAPPQTETATIAYAAANGTFTLMGGFTGSAGDYTMTGTPATIQAALRGLTFVPTAHQVSVGQSVNTSFTLSVSDGFATASNSATTVVATAVTTAPTVPNPIPNQVFTGAGVQSFAFAANTFADSDPAVVLNYSAVLAGGGALPSWLSFNGVTRTFSGDPGVTAASPLTIQVTASDGKGDSIADDFMLTLINVNDAPVLTPGAPVLPPISATVSNSANTGELVSTLVGGRITDGDGDPLGIAVTGDSAGAGGTWQYATNGTTWTNVPAGASASTPLLLNADADTRIRFEPTVNATSTPSITFVAWDGTAGGTEGSLSTVNPNGGGGTSAFSTATETATDAVTAAVTAPPITVGQVQINDGSTQRSEVESIAVTFSGPVNFAGGNGNAASAFQLSRVGSGGNVDLGTNVTTNAQGDTVVTLTFSGLLTDSVSALNGASPSLADGRYTLTVFASDVAGASDGVALNGGVNYVSPTDTQGGGPGQLHLYRLFGDATGNGVVDQLDLGVFRSTFNSEIGSPNYLWYLDADGGGAVDQTSLGQFRQRNNSSVF